MRVAELYIQSQHWPVNLTQAEPWTHLKDGGVIFQNLKKMSFKDSGFYANVILHALYLIMTHEFFFQ